MFSHCCGITHPPYLPPPTLKYVHKGLLFLRSKKHLWMMQWFGLFKGCLLPACANLSTAPNYHCSPSWWAAQEKDACSLLIRASGWLLRRNCWWGSSCERKPQANLNSSILFYMFLMKQTLLVSEMQPRTAVLIIPNQHLYLITLFIIIS